jgi:hypothetical protein
MKQILISRDNLVLTRQKKLIHWIMKKSLFFFIALFNITAFGYTQNFSLNLGKVTLHDSFEKIKKESKITLFYSDDELNVDEIVKADFTNKSALEMVSALVGPKYDVKRTSDAVIVIAPAKKQTAAASAVQDLITITGHVTDDAGKPMSGVNISTKYTKMVAQSGFVVYFCRICISSSSSTKQNHYECSLAIGF